MDATTIIKEGMSLEEKLAAIDAAMAAAQSQVDENAQASGNDMSAPIDPADALICVGCQ